MYKQNLSWDWINTRGALIAWIICQTLFRHNVEIENLPNFNDVKVSRYTVYICIGVYVCIYTSLVYRRLQLFGAHGWLLSAYWFLGAYVCDTCS